MVENKKTINIMHISDIHCGMDDRKRPSYKVERKQTLDAFHESFYKIPEHWKPDIIAITGDIGWSGKEEDYQIFSDFLETLLKKTGVSPENVICCAGNHDKFLPEHQKLSKVIKGVRGYYFVQDVWENQKYLANDFIHFSNWLENIGILPLNNNSGIASTKYLYGYRIINGICFIVLNSAWLCDWREDKKNKGADRGKLLIDKDIVCDILQNELSNMPIIVMFHHPQEWLKDTEVSNPDDDRPTTIDLINSKAGIILNGHTHSSRENSPRRWLQFTAGTISSDDTYKSQCYLFRLQINNEMPKLSNVQVGKFYSEWKNKEVSWIFEEATPSNKIMDMESQFEVTINELKRKNNELKMLKDIVANHDDDYKNKLTTIKELVTNIQSQQQITLKELEKCEIQLKKLHELKEKKQKSANYYTDLTNISEELEKILHIIYDKLKRGNAEILKLLSWIGGNMFVDTLSDAEKKEHNKSLTKKSSYLADVQEKSKNNQIEEKIQ